MIAVSAVRALRRQTQEDETAGGIISPSQPDSRSKPAELVEKKGSGTELRKTGE